MKTRQDHIDFDRNYCVHYAPQPGMSKKDYALATELTQTIESHLIRIIEHLEGHVPSGEEISEHCRRVSFTHANHVEYTWRGQVILRLHPPALTAKSMMEWRIEALATDPPLPAP